MRDARVEFFEKLNFSICQKHVREELNRRGNEALANTVTKQGERPPDIQISVTVDQKGNILR